jgi:multimeric flavodoxin WrbA
MKKNVLVITGSPRKNGNSEMMADSFIEGALKSGHIVNKFSAAEKTIYGCKACDTCWSTDTACSYKDGFTELEPLLENADVVVFATPLYWSSMPSQLKAAIDKLYAYVASSCKRPLKIKESALLVCGECEGNQIFNAVVETYKGIADYMKWENKGIISVPEVFAKGDIIKTGALEQAKKLGMSI